MQLTAQEKQYIRNSMIKLFDEYNYNYTLWALDSIIEEWAEQKETLIEAFKRHPNYIDGKFMIAFANDYHREIDFRTIGNFIKYIKNDVAPRYAETLPQDIAQQRLDDGMPILPCRLYDLISRLPDYITQKTITPEAAEEFNRVIPQIHVHNGEKASRVINRLCQYLGYDKDANYNREFAKFADALSPLTIKRHTILSLNPLDYLTMSFGNSWASCHTIDKDNRRGMPNYYSGCYSSGTISYMLDPSSMVLYTVDASYDGDEYWTQPKINRQMFHYGEDKLVQGRLYPQDNDSFGEAYTPYRQIVQEIMATIFDFPNLWKLQKGTEATGRYITSYGTHYQDYTSFDNCTLSIRKDCDNEYHFVVGADPICIECGCRHSVENNINCCASGYICACCGARISEDDVCWIDDTPYCNECVTYCDRCGDWELNDDATYIQSEGRYVCSYCRDEYYYHCDCCDEWYSESYMYETANEDYICRDCRDEYYTECECCYELYDSADMVYVEDIEEYLCPKCYKEYLKEKEEEEANND